MIVDKLNQLEHSIAAAENGIAAAEGTVTEAETQIDQRRSEIDDARWAQAEEICRLLDGKLATQQEIADGWVKPDGTAYSQSHVKSCVATWRAFSTGGTKTRPPFAKAYAKAKVTPSTKPTKSGKPRKPRAAKPKKPDQPTVGGRNSLPRREDVQDWVRTLLRKGWIRERIVAASEAGTDGWPVPGEALSNGTWGEVCTAIEAVEREQEKQAAAQKKPPGKSWNGTTPSGRQKALRAEKKQTQQRDALDLMELQLDVNRCAADIRVVDVDDFDYTEFMVLKCANSLYDDLISLSEWIDRTQRKLNQRLTTIQVREKIAKLREVRGREPEEAETYLKLADELERRLKLVPVKQRTA